MTQCDLHHRLVEFVYDENRCLDDRQFDRWLSLFADDGVYWIPTQPDQTDKEMHASIALESKMLLQLRITRMGSARAHSLHPQVRSMRVVQRPEVEVQESVGELHTVSCNLVYMEYQAGNQVVLGARVRYIVRDTQDGIQIVEKKISLLNMDTYLSAIQLFI